MQLIIFNFELLKLETNKNPHAENLQGHTYSVPVQEGTPILYLILARGTPIPGKTSDRTGVPHW